MIRDKILTWILVFTMIFTNFTSLPVFSEGELETVVPEFISGRESDWTGHYADEGDTKVYVYVIGRNLEPLTAELATYDGTYTPIAFQSKRWFMGTTNKGEEHYIYELATTGAGLISTNYYIRLKDSEGTYYTNNNAYFSIGNYPFIDSRDLPTEIGETSRILPFEVNISNLGGTKAEVSSGMTINLWTGTQDSLWAEVVLGRNVGSMLMENASLYQTDGGSYTISGELDIIGTINPGEKLFIEFSFEEVKVYSAGIPVTPTNGLGQFKMGNSLPGRSSMGGHESSGSYETADTSKFYIGQVDSTLDYSIHKFELTSGGIADNTKFDVKDNTGVSILQSNSLIIEGPNFGVYTLSGYVNIPTGSTSIEVYYDGSKYHEVPIERVENVGIVNASIPASTKNPGLIQLPSGTKSFQVVLSGLNLPIDNLSALATSYEQPEINLNCTPIFSNGELILNLSSDNLIDDAYNIEIFHNGTALESLYYVGGEIRTGNLNMNIQIGLEDYQEPIEGTVPPAITRVMGNRDLQILGEGFSSDKEYTAVIREHSISGLDNILLEVNATFVSSTELSLSRTITDNMARGWYSIRLKEAGNYINGSADFSLYPYTGIVDIVNPIISINSGASTTFDRSVLININKGSFSTMRFSEDLNTLSLLPYGNINTSSNYELSDGFGEKVIYFEFLSSDNQKYTTSIRIVYTSIDFGPPSAGGVAGQAYDGVTPVKIEYYSSYDLFMQSSEIYIAKVELLNNAQDVVETLDLKLTTDRNGIKTYSRNILFDDDSITLLRFYFVDNLNRTSQYLDIPVTVQLTPYITFTDANYRLAYFYNQNNEMTTYIVNGSRVDLSLKGRNNFEAYAQILYRDGNDVEKFVDVSLPYDNSLSRYAGTGIIPPDAAFISSFEFILRDPEDPKNSVTVERTINLNVSSVVDFVNLPNENGEYNGKYLYINADNFSSSKNIRISSSLKDFKIDGLAPGTYNYSIYDSQSTYISGTFEAKAGAGTSVDLSLAKKPASLKFTVSGGVLSETAYVEYKYMVGSEERFGYLAIDKVSVNLFEDMIIDSYRLVIGGEDLRTYVMPPEITKDLELRPGENVIPLTISQIPTRNLVITTKDSSLTDRVISGVQVDYTQILRNGSYDLYINNSTTTNEEGKATIKVYNEGRIYLVANKKNYDYYSKDIENTGQAAEDIIMDYSDQNVIKINTLIKPLVLEGEDDADLVLLESTEALVTSSFKSILNEDIIAYNYSYGTYKFVSNQSNNSVYVHPHFRNEYVGEAPMYEVALNEYGNATIDVVALPKGVIQANVTTSEDLNAVPYMMIYKKHSNEEYLKEAISGTNSFVTSSGRILENGEYIVYLFNSNELKDLNGFSNGKIFSENGLIEGYHYFRQVVTVEAGLIKDLGKIDLDKMVKREMLSPFEVVYTTKYEPTSVDGSQGDIYIKAEIKINPLLRDKIQITNIGVYGHQYSTATDKKLNGMDNNLGVKTYSPNENGEYILTFKASVVSGVNQQKCLVYVNSMLNNKNKYYYGYVDVETPQISIIAPKQVVMPKTDIYVRGMAYRGSEVEIYDGDVLIGKGTSDSNNYYNIEVGLTAPEVANTHNLYAKMITPDKKEFLSKTVSLDLIDGGKTVHLSDYKFINSAHFGGDSSKYQVYEISTLGDNIKAAYSYNPHIDSVITFTINNAVSSQLEEVYVVNRGKNGEESKYPASLVKDDPNGKYSDWMVEENLGYNINDISVFYSLKEDVDISILTGVSNPTEEEFNNALNGSVSRIDPASVPQQFRSSELVKTLETSTSLKAHKVYADGVVGMEVDYLDVVSPDLETLLSQGFRKIDVGTNGEYYLYKDSSTTTGSRYEVRRTMYLSEGLASSLKGDVGFKRSGILLASSRDISLNSTSDTVRDISGKVDYVGYVQNLGEIVYETGKEKAADLGKFGTGLQVVGGVATAAQIFSGPASLDPASLSSLASQIKDINVRIRIGDDIREYQKARTDSHSISSLMGVVSYGSGYFSLPGKCLSYIVSTGNMVYTNKIDAEYNIWGNGILADITMQLRREEKDLGKKDDPEDPVYLIDPSGYVFEGVKENRIEGIKATAQTGVNDIWFDWNDEVLELSGQTNPQYTDVDGRYGWDVPSGDWRVRYEDDNDKYLIAYSKGMTVPPVHLEVNIGLLSIEQPSLKGVAINSTGVEIEFNKYMLPKSIYDPDKGINRIIVKEVATGVIVPCEEIEFVSPAENTGYIDGDDYQIDLVDSDTFVRRVRFVADEDLYPGGFKQFEDDGLTPKVYVVEVSGNVMSYSGVHMGELFNDEVVYSLRGVVSSPVVNVPGGNYDEKQVVSLSSETIGADIYFTTDGSDPTINSRRYTTPITISSSTVLRAIASKVGYDDSDIVEARYIIGDDLSILSPSVDNLTFSPLPGRYQNQVSVQLLTNTPNVKIYYTLDGSNPTSSSTLYIGPITINKTTTIKAIGLKEGYLDSNLLSGEYTIYASSYEEVVVEEDDIDIDDILSRFLDVNKDDWFYDSIRYVVEKGLLIGLSETKFGPDKDMTRAMVVTVLHRLAGSPTSSGESFKDVEKGSWYEEAVVWASQNGIVKGYGNDLFGVSDSVTREQLGVMFLRYALKMNMDIKLSNLPEINFVDKENVSTWALEAIKWMVRDGIIKGKEGNRLDPLGKATRAEISIIMMRWLELYK